MGSLHVLYLAGVATVQDLGRYGHRALGVPVSGALDMLAAAYANALVGNKPNTALIELFGSIILRAGEDAVVAVSGGLPKVFVGRYVVSSWRPIYLKSGMELVIRSSEIGSISYVAVAGGIVCEEVLGSRSTYVRGGFGCLGRPIRVGDTLVIRDVDTDELWSEVCDLRPALKPGNRLPKKNEPLIVRATKGIHFDQLLDLDILLNSEYVITLDSDRMGYRLDGPPLRSASKLGRLPSIPTDRGYVQIPPDGKPIVLMSDAQTTGGYAVALHVIPPDLDILAQARPHQKVRFREVSVEEAEKHVSKYFSEVERPLLTTAEAEEY
ncbi:MAG: biotin-dependent carboxyltransferase family protein [Desulfurococcaceae archaeon TW002]